jgi:hypothetical protein
MSIWYLQKANENAGWKIFATKTMALPQSFKAEAGDDLSWKAFLLKHVKPMYLRLSRICNYDPRASGKRLKRNKILHLTETCREVLSRHNCPLMLASSLHATAILDMLSPTSPCTFSPLATQMITKTQQKALPFSTRSVWEEGTLSGGHTWY